MNGAVAAMIVMAALQPLRPPLRAIDRGPRSQVSSERLVAVRDEAEWSRLWSAHAPERPRPPVDFSTEMVVGVFAGTRPTPGYGVEIAGWREAAGIVVVAYRETAPPRDAIAAQVLTSPFAIVTIPRHPGEIAFEKLDK